MYSHNTELHNFGLLKNYSGSICGGGWQEGLRRIEKVDTNVQSLKPPGARLHQTASVAPQMRQDAQRLWLEALYCTVSIIGTFSGTCGWSRWRWLMNLRQSAFRYTRGGRLSAISITCRTIGPENFSVPGDLTQMMPAECVHGASVGQYFCCNLNTAVCRHWR